MQVRFENSIVSRQSGMDRASVWHEMVCNDVRIAKNETQTPLDVDMEEKDKK